MFGPHTLISHLDTFQLPLEAQALLREAGLPDGPAGTLL